MESYADTNAQASDLKQLLDELTSRARLDYGVEEIQAQGICSGFRGLIKLYSQCRERRCLVYADWIALIMWFCTKNKLEIDEDLIIPGLEDAGIESLDISNDIENNMKVFPVEETTREKLCSLLKYLWDKKAWCALQRSERFHEKAGREALEPADTSLSFQENWTNEMVEAVVSQVKSSDRLGACAEPKGGAVEHEASNRPQTSKMRIHYEVTDRPFVCTFQNCHRAFKRLEHLKRHHRIHTGERPFRCTYPGCYKSFARSDNLSQHLKVHNVEGTYKIKPSLDALDFMRRGF